MKDRKGKEIAFVFYAFIPFSLPNFKGRTLTEVEVFLAVKQLVLFICFFFLSLFLEP